jgi:hypothetical protein
MRSDKQAGSISLVLLLGVVLVLLILVGIFAGWAFSSRQSYKNDTDQKISAAVATEKTSLTAQLTQKFTAQNELPYAVYQAPESLGSVTFNYPKTWSGYVDVNDPSSSDLLDGYFYPGVLPDLNSATQAFALRVSIISQAYSSVVSSLTGGGLQVTATPFSFPKVSSQVGLEISGQISNSLTGLMVVMPIRNNTLEIWTDGTQFMSDFNNIVLDNLTFSP